jgi:FlaG/FlaF family flagellin (archaellin)
VSSITWTLPDGTVLGTGESFSTTALPYGPATVRARAVFPGGATVIDDVHITITNTAPSLRIQQPADGSSFYQNEQVPLKGQSGDINQPESGYRLRDAQVAWYRDNSGTPFATGHNVTLDLTGVAVGAHTITIRGTDDAGATVTESITINVDPASANPPPTVSITSPANEASQPTCCQEPDNRSYALFDFQADVGDPNGDPLTYTWTETVVPGGTPQTRSTVEDPGQQKVYFTSCSTQGYDWTLSVSDGTSTRSATVRVHVPAIC